MEGKLINNKMKYLFALGLLLFVKIPLQAQCLDCPNKKGIVTNPANPENCEIELLYPSNTNQFLNKFDWAKRGASIGFNSIKLNPYAGWLIPDYSNPSLPFLIQSP
jgi:hypothetical protein